MVVIFFFYVYGMMVVMNLSMLIGVMLVLVFNVCDIKMVFDEILCICVIIFFGVFMFYNVINNYFDIVVYDLIIIWVCISGLVFLMQDIVCIFCEIIQGVNLVEGYGLIEISLVMYVNFIIGEQKEGFIGLLLLGVDVFIMDDVGQLVLIGEVGELWVVGLMVMKGYWNMFDEIVKVLCEYVGKIWLLIGDMVMMDEQGFFCIVDCKKELIIVGGYNIYFCEVEEVLILYFVVFEVVVVGLFDFYCGEIVYVVVVFKFGMQVIEKEIIVYCCILFSVYKVLCSVEFCDELFKMVVGKILCCQFVVEVCE